MESNIIYHSDEEPELLELHTKKRSSSQRALPRGKKDSSTKTMRKRGSIKKKSLQMLLPLAPEVEHVATSRKRREPPPPPSEWDFTYKDNTPKEYFKKDTTSPAALFKSRPLSTRTTAPAPRTRMEILAASRTHARLVPRHPRPTERSIFSTPYKTVWDAREERKVLQHVIGPSTERSPPVDYDALSRAVAGDALLATRLQTRLAARDATLAGALAGLYERCVMCEEYFTTPCKCTVAHAVDEWVVREREVHGNCRHCGATMRAACDANGRPRGAAFGTCYSGAHTSDKSVREALRERRAGQVVTPQ